MVQVEFIYLRVDHIHEPSPEVDVDKVTVLRLELEACVERNKLG